MKIGLFRSKLLSLVLFALFATTAQGAYVVGSGLDDTRCRIGVQSPVQMPKGIFRARWYVNIHPFKPKTKNKAVRASELADPVKARSLVGVVVFDGEGGFGFRIADRCQVKGFFDPKYTAGTKQFPVFRGKGVSTGDCKMPFFEGENAPVAVAMRNLCGEPWVEFVAPSLHNKQEAEAIGRGRFEIYSEEVPTSSSEKP